MVAATWWAGLSVAVVLLAGCAGPKGAPLDEPAPRDVPSITMGNGTVYGSAPLQWVGPEMGPGQRHEVSLVVEVPAGYWEANVGSLGVMVSYDERDRADFDVEVRRVGANGALKDEWGWEFLALQEAPQSGTYVVTVTVNKGLVRYWAEAQIDARPKEVALARDLLPNLVTLPPTELRVVSQACLAWYCAPERTCFFQCVTTPRGPALLNCNALEVVEDQARRCLRFSNRIGNAGEGPFDVRMTEGEQVKAMGGQGQWTQRVLRTDGSWREVPAGAGAFHPTHGHVHYQGMAHYQIFNYDLAAGKRLGAVTEGRKVGFCLVDMGVVDWGLNATSFADQLPGCGLSPGWFDEYWYSLDEQYVEITGVADGAYELVSTANRLGTALESNRTDNSASVVFELKGETVKVLQSVAPYVGTGVGPFPRRA